MPDPADCPFTVEDWTDPNHLEVLAWCRNVTLSNGAWAALLAERPNRKLVARWNRGWTTRRWDEVPRSKELSYSVVTRSGVRLRTVAEVLKRMEKLPEERQVHVVWQTTIRMLVKAMDSGKRQDMEDATAQLARALDMEGPRV